MIIIFSFRPHSSTHGKVMGMVVVTEHACWGGREGWPGGAGLGLTRGGAGRGEGLLVSIGMRDDGIDS